MTGIFLERIRFLLIACILFFTPLMASGKMVYALLFLEMLGICLLLLTLWPAEPKVRLAKIVWVTLFFGTLLPAFYLLPIPLDWWSGLPGRSFYLPALDWLMQQSPAPWLSLSLVPQKTVHACLASIPLLAIFLSTCSLEKGLQTKLVYILLLTAAIQGLLGVIQFSSKLEAWTFFDGSVGSAQGTYLNRDHFSALMHMVLPITIGLLIYHIGRKQVKTDSYHFDKLISKTLIFGLLTILFILAGVFSSSRAGVALTMLGFLLSSFLFARHVGGSKSASLAASLGVISLGLAFSVGMIPIMNRFIVANPLDDARAEIFEATISGIKRFFPFGSGPGTFQELYRTIQPLNQPQFINHAHNDYLELLFETGVLGGVLILLFLIAYLYGWWQLKGTKWNESRFLKMGAGIGILLLLLHSFVDFNLHTPANAIVFVFLVGIFLKK